jgi:Ca2+-transporting ATPase
MQDIKWHSRDAVEIIKSLETHPHQGLTDEEVKKRLTVYGPNELKKEEKISPLAVLFHQFTNTLIIILLIATVLSAIVGEIFDAALIFVIVIFCAVLGFVQEYKAERALEALKKMLSPTVSVIRNAKEPPHAQQAAERPLGKRLF